MRWVLLLWCCSMAGTLSGQSQDEVLQVYTEHPRLFLRPNRLRLLKREKERRSLRWLQFETLIAGKAPMSERGFAQALYYRASGDQAAGRRAVDWALGPTTDLRQLALVFDWCQELLNETQAKLLQAKLQNGIQSGQQKLGTADARSRLLAAVALGDHLPSLSTATIEQIVRTWWRTEMARALQSGRNVVPRDDVYPLFELLHVVRDNLNIDLRDDAPAFFKRLPLYHLLSHYPATYPASENEYRVPAVKDGGEPDLRRAALSRAAELSMVAYDTNAPESQILQGWLLHDHFLLRGLFGITYEFLWANPYLPGLSYYHAPLVYYDDLFGRLFARSSWEESATWLGYFEGQLQLFQDGAITVLNPELSAGPISLPGEAVVFFGPKAARMRLTLGEGEQVFVVGLKPFATYDIEVDDEEMTEGKTDRSGILRLALPTKISAGVRLRQRRK